MYGKNHLIYDGEELPRRCWQNTKDIIVLQPPIFTIVGNGNYEDDATGPSLVWRAFLYCTNKQAHITAPINGRSNDRRSSKLMLK